MLLDPAIRVGNFRQKNNSAEDGIDGTHGYFRRNSGCSAEQKISEFRSEPFRGRENNSEFRSVEQNWKQTPIILFRTLLRKRTQLRIPFHGKKNRCKFSEFHSEPFRGREHNSEFLSAQQKILHSPYCTAEYKFTILFLKNNYKVKPLPMFYYRKTYTLISN